MEDGGCLPGDPNVAVIHVLDSPGVRSSDLGHMPWHQVPKRLPLSW